MNPLGLSLVRPGIGPAVGSTVIVSVDTAVVVFVWSGSPLTGRVALVGLVLFIAAIASGSSRWVGVAAFTVLCAAVIGAIETDRSIWVAAGIWAVSFYAAVEMAWHSLERRWSGVTDPGVTRRRISEVATVVAVSLTVIAVALVLSGGAPARVAVVQGAATVVLVAGLGSVRAAVERAHAGDSDSADRST